MKRIETDIWCKSYDGETFGYNDYSSKEEAINDCDDGEYVGRAVKFEFIEENVIGCEEKIVECLYDTLYQEVGDVAEVYELSTEDETELGKRVAKTVIDFINEKDLQPTCFSVTDIEEVIKDE